MFPKVAHCRKINSGPFDIVCFFLINSLFQETMYTCSIKVQQHRGMGFERGTSLQHSGQWCVLGAA